MPHSSSVTSDPSASSTSGASVSTCITGGMFPALSVRNDGSTPRVPSWRHQ
jgi:hypothetical protein